MSSQPTRQTLISETIAEVAECLLVDSDKVRFKALAKQKASQFSVADLPTLRSFFHDPPPESEHYTWEKHGLGGWLSCCQFAIFEIIYHMGAPALPFIREIAWGIYDWTQGNAIELLIRLAADGVETEEILLEIEKNFPTIRYEASVYAIKPLLSELDSNPALKTVFDRLMGIEEFAESYEELTWVDPDPYNVEKTPLHGEVVVAKSSDYRLGQRRIVAEIDCEGVGYSVFDDEGGRVRLLVAEECRLLFSSPSGLQDVDLPQLLQAKKIAIGQFGSIVHQGNTACIYPASVVVLA